MAFAALDGARYTAADGRPALGIRLAIGGILRLRARHGQAGREILWRGIQLHPGTLFILPKDTHKAALPRARDAARLAPGLEAIKHAALHLEALLKPAIEPLSLIMRDDERIIGSHAEPRTDLLTRALHAPAREVGGVQRGGEEQRQNNVKAHEWKNGLPHSLFANPHSRNTFSNHPFFSEAMSMEKRYFTSDLSKRS